MKRSVLAIFLTALLMLSSCNTSTEEKNASAADPVSSSESEQSIIILPNKQQEAEKNSTSTSVDKNETPEEDHKQPNQKPADTETEEDSSTVNKPTVNPPTVDPPEEETNTAIAYEALLNQAIGSSFYNPYIFDSSTMPTDYWNEFSGEPIACKAQKVQNSFPIFQIVPEDPYYYVDTYQRCMEILGRYYYSEDFFKDCALLCIDDFLVSEQPCTLQIKAVVRRENTVVVIVDSDVAVQRINSSTFYTDELYAKMNHIEFKKHGSKFQVMIALPKASIQNCTQFKVIYI